MVQLHDITKETTPARLNSSVRRLAAKLLGGSVPRVALGLTLITLTTLASADLLGLLASPSAEAEATRRRTAEMLAVQAAPLVADDDLDGLRHLVADVAGQVRGVRSITLTRADGQVALTTSGDEPAGGLPTVRVPLFDGVAAAPWGEFVVRFEDAGGEAGLVPLMLFVAVAALVGFTTFLRRTLRALDPSQVVPARVRAMLDTLREGAMLLDREGRIVLANEASARMLGVADAGRLVGRDARELPWVVATDAGDAEPWRQAGDSDAENVVHLRGHGGEYLTLSCASVDISGPGGSARGTLVTLHDLTEVERQNDQLRAAEAVIRAKNEELHRLATRDGLTGCFNRRALTEALERRFAEAHATGRPLGLIMLDVDHFKKVNDVHGHAAGDDVLRGVAGRLYGAFEEVIRGGGMLARYGGEEFVIVMPGATLEQAVAAAEHARLAICGEEIATLKIASSFGVSCTALGADSAEALLGEADAALYASKKLGRNRVTDHATADALAKSGALPAKDAGGRDAVKPDPAAIVRALLSALTARDEATGEHARRVADLCVVAGRGLLDEAGLATLEAGALLHDVGKLGVPDSVLLKPGPLSPAEWSLMRRHEHLGAALAREALAGCEQRDAMAEIVSRHHVRFDDEDAAEVSASARLLCIADAYDAITSDRPYRGARSHATAAAELRRCAGAQFDPELVELFIAAVEAAGREQGRDLGRAAA